MRIMQMSWARNELASQFNKMNIGQCLQVSIDIRNAAFPQPDRVQDMFLAFGEHRPETPPLVQEEMFTSSYGVKIRAIYPLSGRVTYEKTGREPYNFSPEEVDQIRHGETPGRLADPHKTGARA